MSRNRRRAAPTIRPDDVQGLWNARTLFYRDQLSIILKGLFKVEIPDEWDEDYVIDLLIHHGVFCITDTPGGPLPFRTSFAGNNYMNQPVMCVISVPHFPQMNRKIGKDCEIFFLQRRYGGWGFYKFNTLLNVFAERLASADACIDVNLMNSRVAYLIEAETKAQAETIKQAYSDVTAGEPLVVLRKGAAGDAKFASNGMNAFFNNLRQNLIAGDVQDIKRTIMNEFLTMIGINNANTDKKERLVTGEVDSNNDELACNVNHFKRIMKRQINRIKKLYPDLEFNIELEFDASNVQRSAYGISNSSQLMAVPSPGKPRNSGQN